jgi:hypothetical protein
MFKYVIRFCYAKFGRTPKALDRAGYKRTESAASPPITLGSTVSGNSRFLRTRFRTRVHHRHRVTEGGLHL